MFDHYIDIFFIIILLITVTFIGSHEVYKRLPSKNTNLESKDNSEEKTEDKIERFIVADAQDFQNYQKWRKEVMEKSDTFAQDELKNPPPNRVVNYDKEIDTDKDFAMMVVHGKPTIQKDRDDKAFITYHDFGWEAPLQQVGCANASISQQFQYGDKSLLPYQISCNQPNKITAENYFKTHYRPQVIPIEDYHIRGANYLEYTDFMSPYQVRGYRILSQNTKGLPKEQTKVQNLPVGYNYAFHNTPAMPMP